MILNQRRISILDPYYLSNALGNPKLAYTYMDSVEPTL